MVLLWSTAAWRGQHIVQNQLETRLAVFIILVRGFPWESTDMDVDNISNVAGVWVKGQLCYLHMQKALYLQDLLKSL